MEYTKKAVVMMDKHEIEAVRLALDAWIETSERTVLQPTADMDYKDKVSQLQYHVMLSRLYERIAGEEEYHFDGVPDQVNQARMKLWDDIQADIDEETKRRKK